MNLTSIPLEYQKALPVLKKIEEAGYEAYFVGGSVRDALLHKPIHDVDIATSAFPSEIKEIFPRTIDIGIEHGTVLVLEGEEKYEITTFRTESTYQDYRRPDQVSFVRSLKEDLKRRDFTINAFALKEDGHVIDLFQGVADLNQKVLRAVGNPHERFYEDALRMMRGLRFVSQLGFTLETQTKQSIYRNRELLEKISVERINNEFVRLLLGPYRKAGLQMFVETACFEYCPGLKHEKEGLERFIELSEHQLTNEVQAWVLLMDNLAIREADVKPFLKGWKCSNEVIRMSQAALAGLRIRKNKSLSRQNLYQLGEENAVLVEGLMVFYNQVFDSEEISTQYRALAIHSLGDLEITGHDVLAHLERKPGKWLKESLAFCELEVLEGRCANEKMALLSKIDQFLAQQDL